MNHGSHGIHGQKTNSARLGEDKMWNYLRTSPWAWFVIVRVLLMTISATLVVYLLWALGNT